MMLTERNPALREPEVRRTFEEELLYSEATDTLEALVESTEIARKELASRLGVSAGRVSQILNGGENLTLRSLAAMGWALGIRFELTPTPMADRRGTPACDDPPPPAWLANLRERPRVSYGDVSLPRVGRVARNFHPMLVDTGKDVA